VSDLALRFYKNATENKRDGEEISGGDLTNPVIFDGMYPAVGSTLAKKITVMVRADEGEEYFNVLVGILNGDNNIRIYMKDQPSAGTTNGFSLPHSTVSIYSGVYGVCFPCVGDTNKPIVLQVIVSGDNDANADLTKKMMAVGVKQ